MRSCCNIAHQYIRSQDCPFVSAYCLDLRCHHSVSCKYRLNLSHRVYAHFWLKRRTCANFAVAVFLLEINKRHAYVHTRPEKTRYTRTFGVTHSFLKLTFSAAISRSTCMRWANRNYVRFNKHVYYAFIMHKSKQNEYSSRQTSDAGSRPATPTWCPRCACRMCKRIRFPCCRPGLPCVRKSY